MAEDTRRLSRAWHSPIAAILTRIEQGVDFCAGHKEYAPTRVTAILNGTAPPPMLIPRVDDQNRTALRRGATGPEVARLQQLLGVVGPDTFGPRTEAAVREFQRHHDLVPDGIVGPNTWKALEP